MFYSVKLTIYNLKDHFRREARRHTKKEPKIEVMMLYNLYTFYVSHKMYINCSDKLLSSKTVSSLRPADIHHSQRAVSRGTGPQNIK